MTYLNLILSYVRQYGGSKERAARAANWQLEQLEKDADGHFASVRWFLENVRDGHTNLADEVPLPGPSACHAEFSNHEPLPEDQLSERSDAMDARRNAGTEANYAPERIGS